MKDAAAAWKQLSDEEREPFMAIAEGVCPHLYAFLTVKYAIHSGSEFVMAVRHLGRSTLLRASNVRLLAHVMHTWPYIIVV